MAASRWSSYSSSLIIGILAAIAIPTFLSMRENAYQAQVEADVRSAAMALHAFIGLAEDLPAESQVTFTASEGPREDPLRLPISSGTTDDDGEAGLQYVPDGEDFCLAGWHEAVSADAPVAQWESASAGFVNDPGGCSD